MQCASFATEAERCGGNHVDVIKLCGTCMNQIAELLHAGDAQDSLVELNFELLVDDQLIAFVKIAANFAASFPATSSSTPPAEQSPICISEQRTRLMSCETSSARPSRRHHVHAPHGTHTDEACAQRA